MTGKYDNAMYVSDTKNIENYSNGNGANLVNVEIKDVAVTSAICQYICLHELRGDVHGYN